MAGKTPAAVAYEQLTDSQLSAAKAATRVEQLQVLITWIEEDIKRPCNLQTHHDSRCCPVHQLLKPAACNVIYSWDGCSAVVLNRVFKHGRQQGNILWV